MRLVVFKPCGAEKLISHLFDEVVYYTDGCDLELNKQNDIVFLTGGADISASLYTDISKEQPSRRDLVESYLLENTMGSIGICRGAQMQCVYSGGTIIQHLDNHTNSHYIHALNNEGKVEAVMLVSSTHHQAMNPENTNHLKLAVTPKNLSFRHLFNGRDIKVDYEHEVVYYPETNALAFQYHPEYMMVNAEGVKYFIDLVTKFIIGGKKHE